MKNYLILKIECENKEIRETKNINKIQSINLKGGFHYG